MYARQEYSSIPPRHSDASLAMLGICIYKAQVALDPYCRSLLEEQCWYVHTSSIQTS